MSCRTRQSLCSLAGWVALALLTQAVPLLLWRLGRPIWSYDFPLDQGFVCGGLLLVAVVCAYCLRRRGLLRRGVAPRELLPLLPLLGWIVVTCHYLTLTSPSPPVHWDYERYQLAGEAVLAGSSPYGSGYLYSPVPAQMWELGYLLVARAAAHAPGGAAGLDIAAALFSFYNYLQALLIGLAYVLAYRFARRLQFGRTWAACLCAGLFLMSAPLVVLLRQGQVDLWVLIPLLAALLLEERQPFAAGAAAALALFVKPYTVALLPCWVRDRRWSAVAGMAVGGAVLGGLSLLAGGTSLWRQALWHSLHFPRGTRPDDNGLHAVIYNLVRLATHSADLAARLTPPLFGVAAVLVLLWIGSRIVARERQLPQSEGSDTRFWRGCGLSLDLIALLLVLAPVAWAHHYVLAIPIALWALRCGPRRSLALPVLACLLIFAVPHLDVFPVSVSRLLGLLLLLCSTRLLPSAAPPEAADV
ncbi:glycosyltransferase 87 family protein [bacterium]|nr:glycosyltransferase 87 family protein [bacterium]